jgi:hypothetical protein
MKPKKPPAAPGKGALCLLPSPSMAGIVRFRRVNQVRGGVIGETRVFAAFAGGFCGGGPRWNCRAGYCVLSWGVEGI